MSLWTILFGGPPPLRGPLDDRPDVDEATKVRIMKMNPLGLPRLRILDCIGGNTTYGIGLFDPDAHGSLLNAFRAYVLEVVQRWDSETHWMHLSNIAAARMLIGDLDAAGTILDLLPEKAFELDHGAGRCGIAANLALRAALPLPPELRETKRWTAGSPEQAALREWLAQHRTRLRWMETEGVYRFGD